MLYAGKLHSVLKEIVACWDLPGLAVGLVQDGEIAACHTFGVESIETRSPVTSDTLFCTASVSKVFVATAVMQLVERDLIDLDAPLVGFLPSFQLADERYEAITARQLLSHSSGMPDEDEDSYIDLWSHPEFDEGAGERYVHKLRERRLDADPGERFRYSNIGYNILGQLISVVSGTSFETYMKEHVLTPACMPRSTFLLAEVPGDQLAVPHLYAPEILVSPIYPYHRADAPSSALHASVRGMCHWAIACLNGESGEPKALLQPSCFETMWRPVVERGWPPLYQDMALGWNVGEWHGERVLSHGGQGAGLTAFLALLPELSRAAVVLCNSESLALMQLREVVLDVLVGREPNAGPVSWAVPLRRALMEGGMDAAYACNAALKDADSEDVFLDEDCLVILALQLTMADKSDLAMDVLRLNAHAFPDYAYSHVFLARLHLKRAQFDEARAALDEALAVNPGDEGALAMLVEIQGSGV